MPPNPDSLTEQFGFHMSLEMAYRLEGAALASGKSKAQIARELLDAGLPPLKKEPMK